MGDKLQEAAEALRMATETHRLAYERCRGARAEETSAINQLNEAQKAFDAVVAEIKKSTSRESYWHHGIGER